MKSLHPKLPGVKQTFLFDVNTVTREQLVAEATRWHRGDTGSCDVVVGLIQQLASQLAMEPITIVDLEPARTHAFYILSYETKEEFWNETVDPNRLGLWAEWMGLFDVHGKRKHLVLYYLGARPAPETVAKKVREIGAKAFGGG